MPHEIVRGLVNVEHAPNNITPLSDPDHLSHGIDCSGLFSGAIGGPSLVELGLLELCLPLPNAKGRT